LRSISGGSGGAAAHNHIPYHEEGSQKRHEGRHGRTLSVSGPAHAEPLRWRVESDQNCPARKETGHGRENRSPAKRGGPAVCAHEGAGFRDFRPKCFCSQYTISIDGLLFGKRPHTVSARVVSRCWGTPGGRRRPRLFRFGARPPAREPIPSIASVCYTHP
jgi:hypothetical protein